MNMTFSRLIGQINTVAQLDLMSKRKGADFASVDFTEQDFKSFGKGFDRTDFGFSRNKAVSYAFDIIGLCQRIHGLSTYKAGRYF